MQPSLKSNSLQSGSALVAVAAVLMLVGVFMGLGIDAFKTKSAQDKYLETKHKMDVIAASLASFAQKNNRLPCAGDPNLGYTSTLYGVENCAIPRGDIPVRQLNLPENFMIDAWGRKFRYAASPFATNPTINTTIHAYCRTNDLWVLGITGSCAVGTKYNINVPKAQFCCPNGTSPTSGDIRISLKDGTNFIGRTRATSDMAASNIGVTVASLPARANPHQIESPAYILISHGANGGLNNGANDALLGDELENADADMDFSDRYRDLSTTNFFDDLVLYRTQFQVMAELNSGSCTRPYAGVTPDQPCP